MLLENAHPKAFQTQESQGRTDGCPEEVMVMQKAKERQRDLSRLKEKNTAGTQAIKQ